MVLIKDGVLGGGGNPTRTFSPPSFIVVLMKTQMLDGRPKTIFPFIIDPPPNSLMDSTVNPKGENNGSDTPPNSLMDSTVSPKGENNGSDAPSNSLMDSTVSPKG